MSIEIRASILEKQNRNLKWEVDILRNANQAMQQQCAEKDLAFNQLFKQHVSVLDLFHTTMAAICIALPGDVWKNVFNTISNIRNKYLIDDKPAHEGLHLLDVTKH